MNFLCHAMPYFDDPLVAVCTAIPDWLSVVDRKIRARERMAVAVLDSEDEPLKQVATGILNHIRDDRWFHTTAAFVETNMHLAVGLRDQLPGDIGFRPTFVGHVLIEVFLDAFWIRDHRAIAEQYYGLIESCPRDEIERCVNVITGKPTDRLADVIQRYSESKFLYDYLDHERLLFRLNQVMNRVGLAKLPDSLLPWLQEASELVESRRERFLTPPDGSSPYPFPTHG